ncbi:MAG: HAD-superfamily hydrolase, subfamily IA, variant 1, partial [uncultured Nocardioidaceae bacterium]
DRSAAGGRLRLGRHADAVALGRLRRGGAGAGARGSRREPGGAPRPPGGEPGGLGAGQGHPGQCHAGRRLHRGGPHPRRVAAHGVPRVLGAPHRHRSGRRRAAHPPAGRRAPDRRAVEHRVAAQLARGLLPPRRRPGAPRRRRVHQRGAVDQAVPRGLPGRGPRRRRRRPGAVRLRRRPALRRHLGGCAGGDAHDPRAALRHPGGAARALGGGAGRGRPPPRGGVRRRAPVAGGPGRPV